MFEIKYSNQAIKFLKRLDYNLTDRILEKINLLIITPIMHDSKKIEGVKDKLFRIRVGNFRILYEVDYNDKIIGIVKIDKRERAY
jgi:mRNA interferase RelE/StbE